MDVGTTVCRERLSLTNLLYENRQELASLLNQCKIYGNLNKAATLPVSFCYFSLTYVYINILSKNHIVFSFFATYIMQI